MQKENAVFNVYYSAIETPEIVPPNSLIKANCLDVLSKVADNSVDMILCDLPYGTTACKWDSCIDLVPLIAHYKRIAKERAPIALFSAQPFTTKLMNAMMDMFRFEWIWNKLAGANFANLKNQPLKIHENILIFSKQPIQKFNPILEPRTEKSLKRDPAGTARVLCPTKKENPEYLNGGLLPQAYNYRPDGLKHPTSIRTISRNQKGVYEYQHPTKKPVALCRYLIETYTNAGDLVLDNCLGSGTTAVACVETRRDFIGIEMGDYFDTHCVPRLKESIQQESQKLF